MFGHGFVALLCRTTNEPLALRMSDVSFITKVAHHYIRYDLASNTFLENPHVRGKKSSLRVRGSIDSSFVIRSSPSGSGEYFGGFGFVSDRGFSERCSGISLSVRTAQYYLCDLPQDDAFL